MKVEVEILFNYDCYKYLDSRTELMEIFESEGNLYIVNDYEQIQIPKEVLRGLGFNK